MNKIELMDIVEALRSIGEPTRLRVLALLAHGELSVGELVDILSMSQPRLSRHMKFLTTAGLVERLPEGAWVFYRLPATGEGRRLVDAILTFLPERQPEFARDLEQLKHVKQTRLTAAESYFNRLADSWDDVRGQHYPSDLVEAGLLKAAGTGRFAYLVDIGTGTGRMLTLLRDRYDRAEGIDLSHKMLTIARANLEREGISHANVRHGDATAPPFEDQSADLVIIHQVLHYMDRPERVMAEAARILKPGGRLLVVDFAPHSLEVLRSEHEHRRLGLSDDEINGWSRVAGLLPSASTRLAPSKEHGLSVSIWTADKPSETGDKAA